jgi:hypothetical protein
MNPTICAQSCQLRELLGWILTGSTFIVKERQDRIFREPVDLASIHLLRRSNQPVPMTL